VREEKRFSIENHRRVATWEGAERQQSAAAKMQPGGLLSPAASGGQIGPNGAGHFYNTQAFARRSAQIAKCLVLLVVRPYVEACRAIELALFSRFAQGLQ
jgi:hypothetical protein